MPCVLATVTVLCCHACRYYCIDLEYNQIILDCDIQRGRERERASCKSNPKKGVGYMERGQLQGGSATSQWLHDVSYSYVAVSVAGGRRYGWLWLNPAPPLHSVPGGET